MYYNHLRKGKEGPQLKTYVTNMTEGNPVRLIVSFAVPLMIGNVFQQLYSVVDSMVVGKFLGVDALAALGISGWPGFIVLGMIQGIAQGVSILMARDFGKEDLPSLKKTYGNGLILCGGFCLCLLLAALLLAPAMLYLLSTPARLQPHALLYLRITFAGIPIIMGYNLFASALRALGDSRTPLYAMIVASVLNIVLDILFVRGLSWGIGGAAVATVLAQLFSMIICLAVILRLPQLKIAKDDLNPVPGLIRQMLILSTPMALQNFLIAGGGMVVQYAATQFSVEFIAGFTAGAKLHGVLEIATSSFGFAMTTYVAQNLGAGRMDRIHRGVRSAMGAAVATSLIIAGIMLASGRLILRGFVSGTPQEVATTIDVGYRYLAIMCLCLPVLYLLYVFRSSLQGLGNTVLPMVSAISELIMRTSSALLLTALIGETGLFIAEVAAWFGADFVLIPSYLYVVRKTEMLIQHTEKEKHYGTLA